MTPEEQTFVSVIAMQRNQALDTVAQLQAQLETSERQLEASDRLVEASKRLVAELRAQGEASATDESIVRQ